MANVDEIFVLSEEALDELYAWIDTIPLSRPKRNIARDFSDGVLVAEVVAYSYPKMVDIHNYFTTSSSSAKKINWNTLNRRVFSKMGFRISDFTIQQLIDAKAGAIEQVLWDLRHKVQEPQQSAGYGPATQAGRARSNPPPTIYSRNNPSVTAHGGISIIKKANNVGASDQSSVQSSSPPPEVAEILPPAVGKATSLTSQPSLVETKAPTRTGSTVGNGKHAHSTNSKQSHGYVVPPSISGTNNEEGANNNPIPTGGPPAQIIYRGHKMIPLGLLDEKDREIKLLEVTNKTFSTKIHRLETLIGVKDSRIEDLTHQLHSLRSIYERVTDKTWDGFETAA